MTEDELLAMPEKDYMNEKQKSFFKELLINMKAEINDQLLQGKSLLTEQEREFDELDRAQAEEDTQLRLRIMDRKSKLLPKIDEALQRIEEDEYGYCEVTGEPIGIKRLLIRPTATLCAEEKNRQESIEKVYKN